MFSKLLTATEAKNAAKSSEGSPKVEAVKVTDVSDKEPAQQKCVEHWDSAFSPPDLLIALQVCFLTLLIL